MQATLVYLKILALISATRTFVESASPVKYGPSLVSLTRWDRLVRGPTIFNPDTGRVLLLEDYPNFSVVIPLAPDSPSATSNQVFISRRVSGPGEFTVEAPPGYGVMAVIQSLDLRVAEDACNDFIMFSEVDGGGAAETTGTCGKVDIRDPSPSPEGIIGPRTFISNSGRMKILFYHGFIWGLVRNFNFDIFDSSLNPDLKLEIAFTAYKDCPSLNSTNSIPAESDAHSDNSFATCSPSVSNSKTCIRKELFCDKILNCAFGQDFASDEDSVTCGTRTSSEFSPLKRTQSPSTTTTTAATTTTTTASTTTSTVPTTTKTTVESTTSPLPRNTPNSIISTTTTEKFTEIRHNVKGTGADAAGLIGLVRKFPRLDNKPHRVGKTIILRGSSTPVRVNITGTQLSSKIRGTTTTTKMPLEKTELFADVNSNPVEDPLVNGLSKEEAELLNEDEGMSTNTIIGIVSITGIILILIGILRVYYCYNKVIWNPHGSRLKANESPPETPNSNLMRKMKALAMESEEVFNEKKGKGLKEQPPSYEILFPLPEEKDAHEKV